MRINCDVSQLNFNLWIKVPKIWLFAVRQAEIEGDLPAALCVARNRRIWSRAARVTAPKVRVPDVSASQHAPHWRGRRNCNCDSLTWKIEASASAAAQRSSGNSDSVRGCAAPSSKTSIDRRHANSCVSLISPRYSTCRCTTRPPATLVFSTTLQERCCLPSFPRTLQRKNMMAANYRHIGGGENRLGRHYSRFLRIWPTAFLADQSLALCKSQNGGSNRRSQASSASPVRRRDGSLCRRALLGA